VRPGTALVTALLATTALATGWQLGSHPSTAPLAGVEVVAAPPSPGPAPAGAASPPKTRKPKAKVHQKITGAVVNTPYGTVQVRILVTGKRVTDVQAVHLTDANGESRRISASAAPVLRRESLSAQSAQIDLVSGATYTSQGYKLSLQAALDQAHA
jgi:uncharacterized protein with FMN-binding domain